MARSFFLKSNSKKMLTSFASSPKKGGKKNSGKQVEQVSAAKLSKEEKLDSINTDDRSNEIISCMDTAVSSPLSTYRDFNDDQDSSLVSFSSSRSTCDRLGNKLKNKINEPEINEKLENHKESQDGLLIDIKIDEIENSTEEAITSPSNNDIGYYNISQQLYDSIKAFWGYGCEMKLSKPFLKITEEIAGRVLYIVTGMPIESGDKEIKLRLAKLDEEIVNPTITKLLEVIGPIQKS